MATIADLQSKISLKFTEAVFMNILRKKANCESVKVKRIVMGQESKLGDSYLSTITRFSVDATKNESEQFTLHVIIKAYPKNVGRRNTFRSSEFFINEIAFYDKIWSKLQAFQDGKNLKDRFDNIPNVLASFADDKDGFIAMEDLSFEGFTMAPREEGLDLAHAQIIMRLFARFHALGFAYRDQHPKEFTEMDGAMLETYFAERLRGWYTNFHENLKGIVRDAVSRQLGETYLKKINEHFATDTLGTINKLLLERGELTTVTHGDAWVPNFLMRYNGKTPAEVIMIDFQLTRCASLALDILFFFYSCLDQSLRLSHYDQLLTDYRDAFVSFVSELGSDASWVSTDIIKKDMRHYGPFAVGMSTEAVVMALLDEDDVCDIDMIEGEKAIPIENIWIVNPIKNDAKRQRLAEFIKHIVDSEFI